MAEGEPKQRRIRILMIDDDEAEIDIARFAMEKAGLHLDFRFSLSAETALESLRSSTDASQRPDLILLDLNMPGMNGFEVLRELKGNPELSVIPVIVLTTSDDQRDILECYRLHANAYVTKPRDLHDYDELIMHVEGFWVRLASLPA